MILHTRADSVRIQGEEQGLELLIETDEGDSITVNIQACVFDFYAAVQAEVRPYVLEAEHARAAVRAGVSREAYIGAPEADEPDYDLVRDIRRGK